MYDSLPKNEQTFDIDIVGDTTGHKYTGQFTVKCVLTVGERHSLELEKTRMMADYANPSSGLAGIAVSLATIRTKATSYPDWWKNSDEGSSILDENVLLHIYDKCVEAENRWRKELLKEATSASEQQKTDTGEQEGNPQKES